MMDCIFRMKVYCRQRKISFRGIPKIYMRRVTTALRELEWMRILNSDLSSMEYIVRYTINIMLTI